MLVNVNGSILPPHEAKISVFDRGFLYGDSVYEVVRTYGLVPFELEAHLRRLAASAARIELELPWEAWQLSAEVGRTLLASRGGDSPDPEAAPWNHGERQARIVATRGSGEMGLDPGLAVDPALVVMALPVRGPSRRSYQDGVAAWPVGRAGELRRGGDPAAKTGEHLFHVLAVREAKARGAHEALLLDGAGNVTEGASSNVFAVRGEELVTPPLAAGILEGVTRGVVLDICRELGVPVRQEELPLATLEGVSEVFLTSTVREILPVTRIGDRLIGPGRPGKVTQRLHTAFRERADRVARGGQGPDSGAKER
jgi:branched-chain amino acid aminotransferase